ncbi:MAG: DUF1874 domain-containing protein [Lewinellaceae bacterium]|nr:DUF1874 domain-containing protein [Lewinellaceae bacterium]
MNRYIFNSCVITRPGQYSYRHIDLEEARRWIDAGPFTSTIRYRETARALATLVRRPIEVRSVVTHLEVGDQALVFRLVFPPGATGLPISQKGRISTGFILDHCEIGILQRLPDGPAVALEEYNELAARLRKAGKELARSGDAYYHVIDALKEIREGRIQDAIIGLEVAAEELAFSVGKD